MADAVFRLVRKKLKRLVAENEEWVQGRSLTLANDLKMMAQLLKKPGFLKPENGDLYESVVELAHDADVIVDTLISFVEGEKWRVNEMMLYNKVWALPNSLRKEIYSIGSRIREVTEQLNRYEKNSESRTSTSSVGRVAQPQIREEEVVGLDLEAEVQLQLLLEESMTEKLFKLWIVGMGGIGKTTLASLLYEHAAVAAHFHIRTWLNVSAHINQRDLLLKLIQQLGIPTYPTMIWDRDFELASMIHQHLSHRTYIIVFDDVWSRSQLDFLFDHAFPNPGTLVITSRNGYCVKTWHREYVHEMKILDGSKSWELFLKYAFPSDGKCPKQLERIGRQIVRKCNGLPLAIQEAAMKVGATTQLERVWEEFLESMELSATLASLEVSYDMLPREEKLCFLSLGFFKEETTIRVDKLVQVWVAGGMVFSIDNRYQSYEENGRQIFNRLVGQYLVQVKDKTMDDIVKNCEINYNLHRLAIAKAKEEIVFEVMHMGSNNPTSRKPRHRAICCSRDEFRYSTNQDKHLLSLFFRGGGNIDASPSYWKSFELLKILDLEGFGLKALPEIVGTLITLKYLGLRNNYLRELPHSLGKLAKLEVLDIAQNFMVQLPDIIEEMRSLHHLYMSDIICVKPLSMIVFNLQTLTYISIDQWTLPEFKVLSYLGNLRKLGIENVDENSHISELFDSYPIFRNLDCLILRGYRFRRMPELEVLHMLHGLTQLKLDGRLTRLPRANNFPPNIRYLSLSNSCLDQDPMPILEKLSNLHHLKLKNAYTGKKMVISRRGFAWLRILCFEELWNLTSVQVGKGDMPVLKRLEIKNCPNLKTLPEEMSNLKELKMVTTKDIAAMIRDSTFISNIKQLDIQPY